MPGFASFDREDVPLARESSLVAVYRYDPAGLPRYSLLPNVRVLGIKYREGADPGVARFRYVFNPADPKTDPTSFEQALSSDSSLVNVVQNDERLVVRKLNPDGSSLPLFDGFAQVPELTLSSTQELVTFVAYGVAVREWDTPIGGALARHADAPATVDDVETDLETYFNRRGEPNATPKGADAVDASRNKYPTFLDPLVVRQPDVRRHWTLPMATRYLCFRHNPDQTWVRNPDGDLLDSLLDGRKPIAGVSIDPADPTTYKSEPILVPDYPATGKPWPVALQELLEPNGFGMVFRLESDENEDPLTYLEVFRRQDASVSSLKDLFLQPQGEPLDPSRTNLSKASLARDTSTVANIYTVESDPVRYEASFVLAPGFPVNAADGASAGSIQAFDRNDPSFSQVNRDKYRLYAFDETGEGHWDFASSSMKQAPTSIEGLFEKTDPPRPYVRRRRIPIGELFTLDANRKPLKARLAVSTNYRGPSPGIWDGSGTWQSIAGGFDLRKDRLGIWVNVPNPNGWHIGAPTTTGMPFPAGVLKGVESQSNPSATHFVLRLTCVVEGDETVKATAGQRPSSSTAFAVTRRVDAGGRFVKQVVAAGSEFNPSSKPVVVRDDTPDADAEAITRRLAGEAGEVAGTTTIPRFTNAYRISDKVRSIVGRNLSLRTNGGAPEDEGEVYPAVVGLTWEFDGRQQTVLQLSDHRGDRR